MKKIALYTPGILLAIVVFQITACHKIIDFFNHHGGPSRDTLCRITQITSYVPGDTNTVYIMYNAQGNPDSAVPPAALRYVRPSYLFKYDSLGRLIQLGEVGYLHPSHGYGPFDGGIITWTSFHWENNRIVISTTGYEGSYLNGVPFVKGQFTRIYYEYDSLDRIAKTRTFHPFSPEILRTYTYNADGNLTTHATNDHKVNLFRTNKIWMFLARDYSKNNPLTGATYNILGFPVKTTQTNGSRTFLPELRNLNEITPDHADITYSCRGL